MHSSSRSPCMLMHHLYNADVLVTPHGFQSMLLLFLPRPAVIFEVFPYRYYKRGYGPFGGEYGEFSAKVQVQVQVQAQIQMLRGGLAFVLRFLPCESSDADTRYMLW